MEQLNLAKNGGSAAISGFEGKTHPKVGNEEFLALARRFGYPDEAIHSIDKAIAGIDLGEGPFLGGYHDGSNMRKIEELGSKLFNVKHVFPVSSGILSFKYFNFITNAFGRS